MKDSDPGLRVAKLYSETLVALDAVRRVGEILGETFNEDEICRKAVRIFVHHLPFENCSILLLDRARGVLRLRAAAGKGDEHLDEGRRKALNRDLEIRVGEGIAGEVVSTGTAALLADAGRSPRFKPIPSPIPVRSLLCMPLFSKEEVIGVMNLSHPEIEEISTDQEKVLEVLSRLVGQAITISRLSAELITERLRRSERLASLGQLAASVAHEVNNPLTNVLLRAQKLHGSEELAEADRKLSGEIEEEAEKISRILGSLLDFSRARRKQACWTDINETVRRSLDLTAPLQANRSRLRLEMHLAPELPQVQADPAELEQVFTNLLINAVQAVDRNGEITVTTAATREGIEIRFRDTGCGISDEDQKVIFEPFYTTRTDDGGTGLGLAVCQQIVRGYRGELRFQSRPGEGSEFTVFLPASSDPD